MPAREGQVSKKETGSALPFKGVKVIGSWMWQKHASVRSMFPRDLEPERERYHLDESRSGGK